MENVIMNVRINSSDKKNFEKFCSNVGMNVSTAINMYIKTVIRENRIPFEIKSTIEDEYIYNKLKEADKEIAANTKRYTKEEILKSIDDIINNV